MSKKFLAILVALIMVVGIAPVTLSTAKADDLPDKITIFVDGTIPTAENGQSLIIARWEELIEAKFGKHIQLIIEQPDHDAYYDVMQQQIASGDWPDIIILSSTYYSSYASPGVLWDMTDAWENSQTKNSGRFLGDSVFEGLKINGKLYGFADGRGGGAVTYIKKAWLDKLGLEVPTNWAEYTAMLDAFVSGDMDGNGTDNDNYALGAAGFVGDEAPFINYLPDFYWDAYPMFYQDAEGVWHDGFTEPAMKDALARLAEGVEKRWIDPTTLTDGTKDVRTKFYDDLTGVFTYWSGTWATNNKNNLEANGHDGTLIAIPPLAEAAPYFDRVPPVWSITTACKNPQAVFDIFIDTFLDGAEVQELWTYGVEGFHWSVAAETVLDKTYEEGQFHMLENPNSPGTLYTKAHMDPAGALATYADEKYDHREDIVAPENLASNDLLNENSRLAVIVPSTDEMNMYNGDLVLLKKELISNVALGRISYDEAMADFEARGGTNWSKMIVDSLNALN